ncbi:MAG: ADOP family duplicated permease, partial [Thermoanaerobaculales bacterium]
MTDEMRFHVDMETDDFIRAGLSPDKARREALLRFGGVERFKEEARMARGGRVVEDFFKDVRLALRGLRRSPGFTVVALSMLALGIGANTAIFSVIDAVLLQPLPFPEPERLVQVYETHEAQGWDQFAFSQMNLLDLMEKSTSFEGIGGISGGTMNIAGDGSPERIGISSVTPRFFGILGVTPLLGRTFRETDVAGSEARNVVLLGEYTWTVRFGSDPQIVGKTVQLDGESYEIVGVLPRGGPWLRSELYRPLALNPESSRDNHLLMVVARLRSSVSIEAARAELTPLAQRLTERNAPVDEGMSFRVEPSSQWAASDDLRRSLWVFMGAVGFLLLIACINLANLLLSRLARRRRQIAMCVALGASRARVIRQLFAESAVLGVLGALLGIGVASVGLDLLVALEPGNIPQLESVGINRVVLLFTLGLAIATAVIGTLLPALRLPLDSLTATLREGGYRAGGGRSQVRMRNWLVSGETALSLVLLIGAGLLIRSLVAVYGVDTGFDSEGRLTFEANLPASYTRADAQEFRDGFLDRIREVPSVEAAAAVNMRPVGGGNSVMSLIPVGETMESFGGAVSADWRMISEEYFQAMGLTLVQGRDLTHELPELREDGTPPPLDVVISRSLAAAVWPGEDAVGKQAQLWVTPDRVGTVVGVVEDMRERGPEQDERMAIYFTYTVASWSPVHFVVHTTGEPRAILPTVRAILTEVDPDVPLSRVQTMDELIGSSMASRRFTMTLLAVFAGIALVLALAGLYGVIADSVSQRSQELGIRVALGASPQELVELVVGQGMRPAMLGIGVGLVAALPLSGVLQSLLFGVADTDLATYAAVGGALAFAALVACWIPTRAALKLDPANVL